MITFFGRLPVAMNILGVLTLVTSARESVSDAAITSATLAIANAIGSPILGRWVDRAGQRRPLLIVAPICALALVTLLYLAYQPVPIWVLAINTAIVGATTIPIGSFSRVRWYKVQPHVLTSALSAESVADETVFVLGPALVGILAAQFNPSVPLILTATLGTACIIAFALHPSAPITSRTTKADRPSIPTVLASIWPVIAATAGLGMFFGACQTSTTAFAQSLNQTTHAGLVYAAMGVGAAITALGSVYIPRSFALLARIAVGGTGAAIVAALAMHVTTLHGLAALLFISGLGVGMSLVAVFTLAASWSPKGGESVALTVVAAANVLGVATASSIAGPLLKHSLAHGFSVGIAAGVVMASVAIAGMIVRKRKGQAERRPISLDNGVRHPHPHETTPPPRPL